jgi:hypothetical protein
MRVLLWVATMLFFVAFFTYGYILWRRSRNRRTEENTSHQS